MNNNNHLSIEKHKFFMTESLSAPIARQFIIFIKNFKTLADQKSNNSDLISETEPQRIGGFGLTAFDGLNAARNISASNALSLNANATIPATKGLKDNPSSTGNP
jgi:hypothetical protein